MYYQSDKMKTIEGQYQKIQSQHADGVQGQDDQLCQTLKKSQARLVIVFFFWHSSIPVLT